MASGGGGRTGSRTAGRAAAVAQAAGDRYARAWCSREGGRFTAVQVAVVVKSEECERERERLCMLRADETTGMEVCE
jgi:hypothetical protein